MEMQVDAVALLGTFDPTGPVEQIRYDLALELLDDVKRLDVQLKESHKRIKTAVQASGTTLADIKTLGIGAFEGTWTRRARKAPKFPS
jgi:hypothetical protein